VKCPRRIPRTPVDWFLRLFPSMMIELMSVQLFWGHGTASGLRALTSTDSALVKFQKHDSSQTAADIFGAMIAGSFLGAQTQGQPSCSSWRQGSCAVSEQHAHKMWREICFSHRLCTPSHGRPTVFGFRYVGTFTAGILTCSVKNSTARIAGFHGVLRVARSACLL
jgi:hypothetical protein